MSDFSLTLNEDQLQIQKWVHEFAENVVRPFLSRPPFADQGAITQGYAGVYSRFLLHAERAAECHQVPAHGILQRVGEAGYVGGEEDMIIDVALQLAAERDGAEGR